MLHYCGIDEAWCILLFAFISRQLKICYGLGLYALIAASRFA
jgi:hypothetical protein